MSDLQEKIIGALVLFPDNYYQTEAILNAEMFSGHYSDIYKAIKTIIADGKKVDLITIRSQIKPDVLPTLVKCTMGVNGSSNLFQWCEILSEKWKKDKISNYLLTYGANINDIDSHEVIKNITNDLNSLIVTNNKLIKKGKEALADLVEVIETAMVGGKIGLPSGYDELDRMIGGLQGPNLMILAARPGMGKSVFATSLCCNIKKKIMYVSLEMGATQIIGRVASNILSMDYGKFTNLSFRTTDLDRFLGMDINHITILDTGQYSIRDLQVQVEKTYRSDGLDLLIVDYLQLMTGLRTYKGNREQEISEISRGLKQIAKDYNIPVIALSQLSRSVESRVDKRPLLSDLRESGSIEQDADIVMFLYRPDYYGLGDNDGYTELVVSKNRSGKTGVVELKFVGNLQRFESFSKFSTSSGF